MKRFRSILVGLDLAPDGDDLSQGARRAALQAHWLAERTGARLTFLHSTFADAVVEETADGRPHLRQGMSDEAREAIDALVEQSRAKGVETQYALCEGRPWMEIIRRAQAGSEDLVVVGMRNRYGRLGANIGSVTMKLLRKCPVPVWCVHPRHELVHSCVVAATELGPVGAEAIKYAAYVARENDCALHVVHAFQIPLQLQMSSSRMTGEAFQAELEELASAARAKAERELADAGAEGKVHVGWTSPAMMIQRAAEELDADLVVMGTLTASGPAGMLLGSTAERLLGRIDSSLLGIKPEGFVSPVR